MISYAGLALIILGWGIQFLGKDKNIKKEFILIYSLGVILLAVDGYINGLTTLAILNMLSFVAAFAVFIKIRK